MTFSKSFTILLMIGMLLSCNRGLEKQTDRIYSRYFQEHVKLTILNTKVPKDRSALTLLILNDSEKFLFADTEMMIDSLNGAGNLQPAVVVFVESVPKMRSKPEKYAEFLDKELYPFIKKRTGVRKFSNVTVAGFDEQGEGSLQAAWESPEKFNKAAWFSSIVPTKYNSQLTNFISSSRKRPDVDVWLCYPEADEDSLTIDTYLSLKLKGNVTKNLLPDENKKPAWRRYMPAFISWSIGK